MQPINNNERGQLRHYTQPAPKNRDELSAYAAETKAISSTIESMKYIRAKHAS